MPRRAAVALLVIIAGCKTIPENGYGVDVSVKPGLALSSEVVAQIRTLAEDVSGAETFHAIYPLGDQLTSGAANYIYRPMARSGVLQFELRALDANGQTLATGAGSIGLVFGETVTLTILLDACGAGDCAVPDLAPMPDLTPPPTDAQLCNDICQRMIDCGVQYNLNACSSGCQIATVFRDCARSETQCNALALCVFKQFQAAVCTTNTGYPMGNATCAQTAQCESNCNNSNPGAGCTCACRAKLDPAKALYSVENDICATGKCTQCTPQSFNGPACNACAAMYCGSDSCHSN
jgi:hypothetical protein